MDKVKDYPLMAEFLGGAFDGGVVSDTLPIHGLEEEWAAAERWWEEFCPCAEPSQLSRIRWLGMKADAGYTIYEQDECGGDEVPALPWRLLDRYY